MQADDLTYAGDVASFWFDLLVPGSPAQVWARLWDLDRHTAAIPLTTVDGEALAEGRRFVARTGRGPLGFDDVMVVTAWDPPRRAVIEKVGRVLGGQIEVTLRPAGRDTRLRWEQDYSATAVPDRVAALVAPGVRAAYLRSVRQIARP